MPLISAAGQALFGEGLRSELWVIAIAYGAAAALTFVVAMQMSGSVTIAALTAVLPVVVYPVTYSYPKLLAPALGCAGVSLPPFRWWWTVLVLVPAIAFYTIVMGTCSLIGGLFDGRGRWAHVGAGSPLARPRPDVGLQPVDLRRRPLRRVRGRGGQPQLRQALRPDPCERARREHR